MKQRNKELDESQFVLDDFDEIPEFQIISDFGEKEIIELFFAFKEQSIYDNCKQQKK